MQHAQLVAGATVWPGDLQASANQMTAQLTQLRTALESDNMSAAMTPAHEAHEVGHDLSSGAYAWLAGQANLVAPGGDMGASADDDAN